MSNGTLERECARDTQCEHCGRFWRNDGIHSHEENCEFQDVDARVVDLENRQDREDVFDDVETPDPTPDGVGADPDPTASTPTQDVATDGGPRDPPEPDVAVDGRDVATDGGENIPDRFVQVGEWCDGVEDDKPELKARADWQDHRRELEQNYDYVDLLATERSRGVIAAVTEDEI